MDAVMHRRRHSLFERFRLDATAPPGQKSEQTGAARHTDSEYPTHGRPTRSARPPGQHVGRLDGSSLSSRPGGRGLSAEFQPPSLSPALLDGGARRVSCLGGGGKWAPTREDRAGPPTGPRRPAGMSQT
jgi:hypothetical protein